MQSEIRGMLETALFDTSEQSEAARFRLARLMAYNGWSLDDVLRRLLKTTPSQHCADRWY
jgi:hypothetical protein